MPENNRQDSAGLRFLYRTVPGRMLLRVLTTRGISKFSGVLLDSPLSKPLINGFFRKNGIDRNDYLPETYRSFNDCFCRRIKPELRPLDTAPDHLVAPCDGLLSVYRVTDDTVLPVKQSRYRIPDLLQDRQLAECYRDGWCFVFRLCVCHYHRYIYPDDGEKGKNIFIKGRLHTVRPIALETTPVFVENCRAYTVLESTHFGKLVQMEVGAMLVGRICNLHEEKAVTRGEEKGYFQYGGSTVILLVEKDAIQEPTALLQATADGTETPVRVGECIAIK